jgi:PadR family transcriptional regulator, regulatory protein PadR
MHRADLFHARLSAETIALHSKLMVSTHLVNPSENNSKKPLTTYTMYNTVYATHYMPSVSVANPELYENIKLELRRGCLIVAALAHLRSEHYGYTLRKALADQGLDIDEGTLYPLLRRLETQGLLTSEWREENKRNKRFYRLSPAGEIILGQLLAEWQRINASLTRIVDEAINVEE